MPVPTSVIGQFEKYVDEQNRSNLPLVTCGEAAQIATQFAQARARPLSDSDIQHIVAEKRRVGAASIHFGMSWRGYGFLVLFFVFFAART